ncbi:unnamed protein product, partial [Scytosiphon promiscuus]
RPGSFRAQGGTSTEARPPRFAAAARSTIARPHHERSEREGISAPFFIFACAFRVFFVPPPLGRVCHPPSAAFAPPPVGVSLRSLGFPSSRWAYHCLLRKKTRLFPWCVYVCAWLFFFFFGF